MMIHFTLEKMQVPFEYYFIALSMLAGFATLSRNSFSTYLRLFPFFLLLTFITELWSWRLGLENRNNIAFYNFFSLFAFVFYLYVLRQVVFSKKAKKVILFIIVVYTLGSLYNILFVQKIDTFHTITYSIGCFLIVAVAIYYFLELFKVRRSINLKREPGFWIVSGLLFFYSCTLPILGVINYLGEFPEVIAASIEPLITILNVLLYSLFTIAFLCRINFRRFTL